MEKGFNHFAKGSMVPTAAEERAMMLKALGGEVSNALNKVDGVLEANVIVNIPENERPDAAGEQAAAIRLGDHQATGPAARATSRPSREKDVQQFVATAVQELKPDNGHGAADAGAAARGRDQPGEPPAGRVRPAHDGGQRQPVPRARGHACSIFVLAMIGLSAWVLMRGGGGCASGPPVGRARGAGSDGPSASNPGTPESREVTVWINSSPR